MAAEVWDLYTADGCKTERTMLRGEEVPHGLYHIVVHIWPLNGQGELLAQRRAQSVQWKPGVWACTGGAAIRGEDALTAARRELREELGYAARADEMRLAARLRRVNSFCNVYALRLDCPTQAFTLQAEEVDDVRWCSPQQIADMVERNQMYNYGDAYFRMLFRFCRQLMRA